jgi:histidyl-tRNA synthetase
MSNENDSIVYKCPKGTRDYSGAEQYQREKLVNASISAFRLYNAVPMDTPSFELIDAITKGCDSDTSKETFGLLPEDDDSERYTLRYDQTMPFARFAKQSKITKMRRYQIGYVYRQDQPNMGNGRYRQFLQADYDNLGSGQDIPSVDGETVVLM